MKIHTRAAAVILVAALAAACGPIIPPTGLPPEMQTAAAETVQAVLSTEPERTPESTAPAPGATKGATLTATASTSRTPSATITPTYSVPVLRISQNTNCRTGPGQQYDILFTWLPGAIAEIKAYYPEMNYWVVQLPDSDTSCWVWGEFATPAGSYWTVPSTTPPATFTPAPPEAPTGLRYSYTCTFNGVDTDITTTLQWTDRSENEQGFRVVRNDKPVADLPANTTTYTETFAGSPTDKVTYSIQVFASTGTAQSAPISFSCQ
ncbi:MAG: hypothetical protein ACM3QS_12660 [Bacteroidota bacterium]